MFRSCQIIIRELCSLPKFYYGIHIQFLFANEVFSVQCCKSWSLQLVSFQDRAKDLSAPLQFNFGSLDLTFNQKRLRRSYICCSTQHRTHYVTGECPEFSRSATLIYETPLGTVKFGFLANIPPNTNQVSIKMKILTFHI